MIGNLVQGIANVAASTKVNKPTAAPLPSDDIKKTDNEKQGVSTVSTIARQLGESAVRAEARDRTSSRAELGAHASRVLDVLIGPKYQAAKAVHDREVPNTKNPETLQRAINATDYMTRKLAADPTAKSPFAGLSHAELVLIAYDDKGPYTVNERRAAWEGVQEKEFFWRDRAVSQGTLEYSNAKKMPGFYTDALAHYRTLPAIEKAQYPANYESGLEARIDGLVDRKPDDRQYNLFEILAGLSQAPETKKTGDEKGKALERASAAPKDDLPKTPTPVAAPNSSVVSTKNNRSPDACPNPADSVLE